MTKAGVTNPRVDGYFDRLPKWHGELALLRQYCLESGLREEYKWMHPCYTFEGHNVVLLGNFKEYCAFTFVNGVLLSDPQGILKQQTEHVQVARTIHFSNVEQIAALESTLKAYIAEAIEVERAGLKAPHKETADFPVPEELEWRFEADPDFEAAFHRLTPGRQRGYLYFFAQPKRSETRVARVEKFTEAIYNGKGYQD